MDKIIELVSGIDWKHVGTTIVFIVTTVVTIILWIKRNLFNVKDLADRGALIKEKLKYDKANLKQQNAFIEEVVTLKKTVNVQERLTKEVINKMLSLENKLDLLLQEKIDTKEEEDVS